MRLTEILKSSLATLRMNGRRTFLTMFGIIIGIMAVITILSLGNGVRKQTLDNLVQDDKGRSSQVFNFNLTNFEVDFEKLDPFPKETLDAVAQIAGVDEVRTQTQDPDMAYYVNVRYANKDPMSYNMKTMQVSDENIIAGRNLNENDSNAYRRNAIVDVSVVSYYFDGDLEAAIHKSLTIDSTDYTIVGVYQTEYTPEELEAMAMYGSMGGGMGSAQIILPSGTYQMLNPQQMASFSMTAYFKVGANIKAISRQISDYLKDKGKEKDKGEYTYFDTSEMMRQIGDQLNQVTYFIGAVAGISLFIAGVGVMNMMYISVSERTKEIGIRRSMGATQRSIQWQFLLEGISITTLGGLIGYLLGIGIAIIAGNFLPFKPLFDVPTALLSVGISVLIGISFSVFPARSAARKNVVEILR